MGGDEKREVCRGNPDDHADRLEQRVAELAPRARHGVERQDVAHKRLGCLGGEAQRRNRPINLSASVGICLTDLRDKEFGKLVRMRRQQVGQVRQNGGTISSSCVCEGATALDRSIERSIDVSQAGLCNAN